MGCKQNSRHAKQFKVSAILFMRSFILRLISANRSSSSEIRLRKDTTGSHRRLLKRRISWKRPPRVWNRIATTRYRTLVDDSLREITQYHNPDEPSNVSSTSRNHCSTSTLKTREYGRFAYQMGYYVLPATALERIDIGFWRADRTPSYH